ncbi:hypothetical protein DEJ36_08210 [Curtobacterium sp. MCPF17_052]|nr:hypothetical protein [Curtobacterium sp. MCPF17_052]WIB13671.1 hypothetical protein DEJ36_08210 [Curtobacterium sp. MCPF17_052]
MPARFVYWMNVSLDLLIERDRDDHSGLDGPDWLHIDEPLHREFNDRARSMSMFVEGRVVRDMMDPFWPDARHDDSLPQWLREFGEIWTDIPKVLVSRTRTSAEHHTRVIGGDDAIEQLAALRRESQGGHRGRRCHPRHAAAHRRAPRRAAALHAPRGPRHRSAALRRAGRGTPAARPARTAFLPQRRDPHPVRDPLSDASAHPSAAS